MLEDIPIISMDLKIMKFLSLILNRSWRSYFCCFASVSITITQFLDVFYSQESIDSITKNMHFIVIWFNATMRTTNLLVRMDEFSDFLQLFEQMYREIEQNEDPFIKKRLKETTKKARNMAVSNLFLGLFACAGIIVYPLVTNEPALPYGMTIPGIDIYKQPYYMIIYTYQIMITPIGCFMFIPFSSMMVAFMMFGALISNNLQSFLRRLKEPSDSNKVVFQRIVWCIRYHLKFINYTKILNGLFTYIALLELITFGATLCALLFLLNIAKSFEEGFIVCSYITMILTQIFNLYWFANELSVQCTEIANVAYDTPWTEFDVKSRKALQMLIMRAQDPRAIMIGNVYPMTMEVFQSALNAAYSFFTIIRRIYG